MTSPVLKVLDNEFSIYRSSPEESVPPEVLESSFYWVGRTDEELSVVCDSSLELPGGERNPGWSCLKVLGPIDFGATGLLAGISEVLAASEISIFALSTFDTDYVLVKSTRLEQAKRALEEAGFGV